MACQAAAAVASSIYRIQGALAVKLRVLAAAAFPLAALWAAPTLASSDSTCYPRWSILQGEYQGCSNTALIAPGNDTRVNLLMLLHDRHGAVGPTTLEGYEWDTRRGDARPFDFFLFAHRLGGVERPAVDEDAEAEPSDTEGTRCKSNDSGTVAFLAALAAERRIDAREREALAAMRRALNPRCGTAENNGAAVAGAAAIRSAKGRAFARYLTGAAAFYDGQWDAAAAAFAGVGREVPWAAEAARYMAGRTELNRAMDGAFDDWGDVEKGRVPAATIAKAERELKAYLTAYPAGRYAASARGLLRKVYWLSGQREALMGEYLWQFGERDAARRSDSLADLVQEMDNKLLDELTPANVTDPLLLAVLDLKAMRRSVDADDRQYDEPLITRAALNAQRSRFVGQEALFAYVQAAHSLYVTEQPAEVLQLIPANDRTPGYLGYSRRMLRALAMDKASDTGARAALLAMVGEGQPFQRAGAELALAMHDERHDGLGRVFAANSPVRDAGVREVLLRYAAGPALLRRVATAGADARERTTAQFVLLYKDLTRGAYGDFVADVAALPPVSTPVADNDYSTPAYTDAGIFRWAGSEEFACPGIGAVAQRLTRNAAEPRALLCLGEFVRLNGLDPGYRGIPAMLDESPGADELGGAPTRFGGTRFSRLTAYGTVIADPRAAAEDEAYALYRAVNCYAPSAFNGCDASEVALEQRRAWFNQLKTRYPASRWARELRYYW